MNVERDTARRREEDLSLEREADPVLVILGSRAVLDDFEPELGALADIGVNLYPCHREVVEERRVVVWHRKRDVVLHVMGQHDRAAYALGCSSPCSPDEIDRPSGILRQIPKLTRNQEFGARTKKNLDLLARVR
jgi:hypothetical protein